MCIRDRDKEGEGKGGGKEIERGRRRLKAGGRRWQVWASPRAGISAFFRPDSAKTLPNRPSHSESDRDSAKLTPSLGRVCRLWDSLEPGLGLVSAPLSQIRLDQVVFNSAESSNTGCHWLHQLKMFWCMTFLFKVEFHSQSCLGVC